MGEKLTRTQLKNLERFGGVNPADQPFSRRQFAAQVGGYALAAGGAVAGGTAASRSLGHGRGQAAAAGPAQRLFGQAGRSANPAWSSSDPARCGPRTIASKEEELKAREDQAFSMVKAALDSMGGVSHFIQKGDVVVIKPNVAFDKNPDLAATTQPDTVSAVIRLCFGAGPAR